MRTARLAAAVITFAVTATAIRAAERPVVVVTSGQEQKFSVALLMLLALSKLRGVSLVH